MKWYHWLNEILSGAGLAIGLDIVTTKEILGLVLVIANIIVLIVSLILKLVSWFKEASADGKITKEEIDEAIDIVDDAKDKIDNINKGDK